MGRPVSTGSIAVGNNNVRAYLHIQRLRRIAEKLDGVDAQLLEAAAQAMQQLADKNRHLGRCIGRSARRKDPDNVGASFPVEQAAEGICELTADGPVFAYIGRRPDCVRVTRKGYPPGVRRIGQFDIASDYREVRERVQRMAA